jgi:uncharacterized Tic20 family protein
MIRQVVKSNGGGILCQVVDCQHKEVVEMTLQLVVACLVAALLAVGASVLAARAALPGWLCRIIELAVLLLAFVWLQQVLRV